MTDSRDKLIVPCEHGEVAGHDPLPPTRLHCPGGREVVAHRVEWCIFHKAQRGQGLRNECWRGQKARDLGYDDYEDCKMTTCWLVIPDD